MAYMKSLVGQEAKWKGGDIWLSADWNLKRPLVYI